MKKIIDSNYINERNKLKRYTTIFKKKHSALVDNTYPKQLVVIFERYLEHYGHAYCMDLKKERKKTAKIMYELLCDLKK